MKTIVKTLLLAAVMAVFIMLPMKVQAATHDVSTLEELKTVVASAYSGDTINITGDITLDSDLTITNPNAFAITSSGSTITCGSYKIVIGSGADVTVGGNLAITGAATSTISVQSGGRFALAGGTVSNSALYAIESSGNAVISGGAINTAGNGGVGVRALSGGVTISGGAINATGVSGIGIQAVNSASVTIGGGMVSASGTGVRVENRASVTINSGTVSASGSGVLLAGSTSSASATINGGTVSASGGAGTGVQVTLGTAHINGGTISGDDKGVNLASGQVNITVSGGLTVSGGVFASTGPSFLSALPSPVTVTAGHTGQVAIAGVDGSITFAIDPATSSELAASIASNTVTLQPVPATPAGGYDLVLTAQSGSGNLKLTVPVSVENLDISGDFTDPNFRQAVWEWLGNSGAPGSFTKQDLIARMSDQGYTLYVDSKNIASLAGLEHFQGTGIQELDCSYNQLTSLPALPDSLISLYCYNNQLTGLPSLPGGLQTLNCNYNQLTQLPALPASLNTLRCASNRLTALPSLGANVITVECGYNQLTGLPQLPSGLSTLGCNNNQLEALPELPPNLQWLFCDENRLTSLPDLPDTLTILKCDRNFINVFSGPEKDRLDACPAATKTVTPQYRYAYTGTGLVFTRAGETLGIQAADVKKEQSDDGNMWTDTYVQTDFGLFAFASSDENVAAVDSQGVVTAAGNGSCVIYARFAGIASAYTQIEVPISILVPPSITTQPESQTVTAGQTATFSVEAAGDTPLSYQWKKDGVNLSDGGNISGAATNTLTISNVQLSDAGSYAVMVWNALGGATSNEAILTVNTPPNRKSDVPATTTASVTVYDAYTLDLSTIFEDADGDNLTYKVSVNGAAYAAADKNYSYTPAVTGTATLIFKAYDGTEDSSDTYTVSLNVEGIPVSIQDIPGVTPPERGATPVTVITETDQYTGTVSWSPNHNPFASSTVYTATIILTPKGNYTLTGVAENYFKVAGAVSVSNEADSGVVTAEFPATAPPNSKPVAKSPAPVICVTASGTTKFNAYDIAEDADGDPLTITAMMTFPDSNIIATTSLDSGTVTLAGKAAGETSFTVKVSDGEDFAYITVQISVTEFAGGDGTEANPYQIADAYQLNNVRKHLDKHFILISDIDLDVSPFNIWNGWEPIGDSSSPFCGSFNGGNHTISNLKIRQTVKSYVGLFGYIGANANVRNVKLKLVDIVVDPGELTVFCAGGLAGYNEGSISKCHVSGSVSGDFNVGGLVGQNDGLVSESSSTSVVSGDRYVGGLVGSCEQESNTVNCYSAGRVQGSGNVGGLVGYRSSNSTVTGSFWDTQTSCQVSSQGGTGKTTAEMKRKSTFMEANWDFDSTWNIVENSTYPYFKWQTDDFDFAPPVFAENYPQTGDVTHESAELQVQMDEAGTVYYVVLESAAGTISAAQIKEGTDSVGNALNENRKGSLEIAGGGVLAETVINGLDPETEYYVYMTAEDAAGNLQPDACISSVQVATSELTPVYITKQPLSQTVTAGQAVTFTVEAAGTEPLNYRWKKGGADLTDNGSISGAATATLTISNVQAADAGSYTC
ncbi:MAG: immunoglobulin domain-containing protein, partial [Eubacteriales bacterium]|nr:immunoglobulin domain-containing protein [Eubacteriales bacterium]